MKFKRKKTFLIDLLLYILLTSKGHELNNTVLSYLLVFERRDKFTSKIECVDSNKQEFTYSEILSITNNFERVVGKGGFGTVYYGCIGETQVAVKMLSPSTQGHQQFHTEVSFIMIAFNQQCFQVS